MPVDHRSFFSLGRYVNGNGFIQIISFFEQSSFKLLWETVIGIVLYYSREACCLLYYSCEITNNNGIPIYLSACNCGFGFEQKYWRIDGFGGEKNTDRRIYLPLFPPSFPIHLRWDRRAVAGPTVKMIAHCMTYITGEILGRFNK